MKINFFKHDSHLYPFRWFIVFAVALVSLLAYSNSTGWRLLQLSNQEEWSANGPGYHK